ncbi:LysR family transcriptional regulator [Paraburkholderia panacisoli]|uniref:LysR family transcriptional regulator n=1 Tax=Paraburkholderia panacisoli TaxID=2603818 RepID=A0A5B0H3S2_9BURK|nr:LysR family transcriptional regulator [Paraburkholderia panacisoli]KAA1009653.1 LysR family transcriptional regulator [Paraburkholderia panacisoli]
MNDRFQELRLFVRAGESGSFSAAAREMGLSQPSVSRIVSGLEARLGVRLLLRTTRKIVPTEAGHAYLKKAKQLLLDLEEADEAARGGGSLKGTLRVAVSETLCIRTILPNLRDFLDGHPQLKLEFLTADVMHDLVAEGVDMAIRFGPLPDSAFGVKKLATLRRLLMASPSYVEQHGAPKTPAELAHHDCIFGPTGVPTLPWEFTKGAEKIAVKIDPRYSFTSAEALIACAREGLGIARASVLMCKTELETGQLIALLPRFALAPVEIHAVFPAGRIPSQKVRSFTEFLAGVLADLK